MGGRGLEPIERGAFEVGKHECHLAGFIQEILSSEYNVHGALEYESIKLCWVRSVKWVGAPWLDTGLGFGRCRCGGGTESVARQSFMAQSMSVNWVWYW